MSAESERWLVELEYWLEWLAGFTPALTDSERVKVAEIFYEVRERINRESAA